MKKMTLALSIVVALSSESALAGVCEYRPTALLGVGGTTAVAAGTGAVGGAGAAGTAAGLYTMTHAVTGATMLGSTAGGASAAGTVGIMGGTAGAGATAMGVILNPLVWIPAAVAAAGTVVYEGGCYIAGD